MRALPCPCPPEVPPTVPGIEPGEVHVFRATLAGTASRVEALRCHLSGAELERIGRFRRSRDARRAIVSRATLRVLLGRYLDRAPAAVELVASERGKPALRDCGPLRFNVAHSGDLALYAFTRAGDIGIDVERARGWKGAEAFADRFFSPEEIAALRSLEPRMRSEAFLRCWTRKEAVVKATGEGLFRDLSSFAVTLRPGEPARVVIWREATGSMVPWVLRHLVPARGHVGALAVRGEVLRVRRWTWEGTDSTTTPW